MLNCFVYFDGQLYYHLHFLKFHTMSLFLLNFAKRKQVNIQQTTGGKHGRGHFRNKK